MEATRAESSGAGPRRQIEEIEEISIAWRVKREKSTAPSEGRILEENSLDARGSYPHWRSVRAGGLLACGFCV